MSDEIIPWEVDTRITGLQDEIESLRRWKEEATQVLNSWDKVWYELGRPGDLGREISESSLIEIRRLKDFNQRLMQELSQHGWGDSDDYPPQYRQQDRNVVALLEEGGFQFERVETIDINTEPNVFEREQSTLETRPGPGRDDGIRTTGQETV